MWWHWQYSAPEQPAPARRSRRGTSLPRARERTTAGAHDAARLPSQPGIGSLHYCAPARARPVAGGARRWGTAARRPVQEPQRDLDASLLAVRQVVPATTASPHAPADGCRCGCCDAGTASSGTTPAFRVARVRIDACCSPQGNRGRRQTCIRLSANRSHARGSRSCTGRRRQADWPRRLDAPADAGVRHTGRSANGQGRW